MKKWFLTGFLIALIWVPSVQAIDASPTTTNTKEQVKLTYPIAELGNCESAEACKAYCDDPNNATACVTYAKLKKFYKPSAFAEAAKRELGCDPDTGGCKDICAKEENKAKCQNLAERFNKKYAHPDWMTTLMKELKCDSVEACKKLCYQAEYQQKCLEITKGKRPEASQAAKMNKDIRPIASSSAKYAKLEAVCQESGCRWNGRACICPIEEPEKPKQLPTEATNGAVQGVSVGPDWVRSVQSWFRNFVR